MGGHLTASLRLLRRVGVVDPASLDDYRARDGYAALRRALEIGPADVIREVTDAKLMGRGGAAFPTGRKWDAVAKQTGHHIIPRRDLEIDDVRRDNATRCLRERRE